MKDRIPLRSHRGLTRSAFKVRPYFQDKEKNKKKKTSKRVEKE
ncbi:Hypothetical protein Minf_1816 [Methylacidiphilum infernorum V4]|uniref:Uncharacterized protein n=1 Tax=Methylacidiphilum infernorum (isolate V4) TaxID=481448 RepID=B3DXG1_METI4|nr:Hypothetical protein Minf_1816 [Methylacidiphilum infernorum V4]